MARLLYAVPCLYSITDRDTNLPTYVHVVERLIVENLPTDLEGFTIATHWIRTSESDSVSFRIRVLDPDEEQISVKPVAKRSMEDYQRYRVNAVAPLFEAKKYGRYSYLVEAEKDGSWEEVANIPLDLMAPPPAQLDVEQQEEE